MFEPVEASWPGGRGPSDLDKAWACRPTLFGCGTFPSNTGGPRYLSAVAAEDVVIAMVP